MANQSHVTYGITCPVRLKPNISKRMGIECLFLKTTNKKS